ncbi:D-isomer specific 2-hydroxyacid dehydrogenase family protein [Pseudomonas sp. Xaverov 259]|uniref:D-isomer specific 2-hydroxyacid dehydrogenase family protein n=1 Tax=Pseudomonas sp. Xaverov 259 TaxID=2666086 RepID=UPI001C5A6A76|nr:D-isomer specific 2-hydroxyacid dehydrogenase family protein [Pseudomonas sp. Xaverov 259]
MKKLLVTGDGYAPHHFASLRTAGYDIRHLPGDAPHSQVLDELADTSVHLLGGSERFGAHEFGLAKKLELISFVGTGIGAFVDEALAHTHGVKTLHTPPVMAPAVAELTVGLLLCVYRAICVQNREVKQSQASPLVSRELAGARVGVIGLGNIGRRVAAMLSDTFGAQVAYHSTTRKPEAEQAHNLSYMALDDLLRRSEVVVLALPTNAQTENIINAARLALLPASAVLINTAGPRLVDPHALKLALDTGALAAAAFDGYYAEPLPHPADDPWGLLALPDDKFIITPHTAAKTPQTWERMVEHAVSNVLNHAREAQR